MADYTFRPWQEGDDLELIQIWPDAENMESAMLRSSLAEDSDAPWRRTVVAEHHGVPVAAGVVYETSLHSQRLWSYLEVAPDHRRQGLGTRILGRLRELAQGSPSGVSALRTKVVPGSTGAGFALAAGFGAVQRSRMVRVEAGALPSQPLREDSAGRPTQAIEDLATGSLELTAALWRFYTQMHQWDPPAEQSLGRVNRLFLSEEAEAFGAVVLREGVLEAQRTGTKAPVAAFAVSYRSLDADHPEREVDENEATEVLLGYDPAVPEVRFGVQQLLALLVHQYPVVLQVDDSMDVLVELVDALVQRGTAQVVSETLVVVER